ncbi:MAG: hypothetical protein BGO49_00885 [Planctomycetales bacterium 71-10]|nr:MAG: hypothetical protein BGO49_00885 [Planctomycetales bacterium 71-10]
MDRFVTLDRLPDDFAVPAGYADRLTFDAAARRLTFQGYMSKTDFDRLSARTRDWAFRRKLEELFQQCVYNGRPEPRRGPSLLDRLRRRIAPG